jgi:putative ABC transport system substrate-binding protein
MKRYAQAMHRRAFVTGLSGALAFGSATAEQAGRAVRVGRLSPLSAATDKAMFDGFRAGLHDLGWVEGNNVRFEMRFADGRLDRLPAVADELVRLGVDVIVTGSNPGALAAKRATGEIPIVFVTTGDPIAGGLVPSLRRPGGNLTGVTTLGVELNAKRLELLKEGFGAIARVAVLTNPGSPYTEEFLKLAEQSARVLGLQLQPFEIRDPLALGTAFDHIGAARFDAILVLADILFVTHRQRIVEHAARTRLPAIYPDRAFVDAGGVMFYGAALPDMYRHAATHVDRILKGAKPADLPVEQPTKFRLVVNLKAAKAMGLTVQVSLLLRADELIE